MALSTDGPAERSVFDLRCSVVDTYSMTGQSLPLSSCSPIG